MKNFTTSHWNEILSSFKFSSQSEAELMDINLLAKELSSNISLALDIIAPMKTFSIRPNYVQGLTEDAKLTMKSRDYVRSQLKNNSLSVTERKVKVSFWGLFKTNFYDHFRKLFLFTKFNFSKFREKVFLNYT